MTEEEEEEEERRKKEKVGVRICWINQQIKKYNEKFSPLNIDFSIWSNNSTYCIPEGLNCTFFVL